MSREDNGRKRFLVGEDGSIQLRKELSTVGVDGIGTIQENLSLDNKNVESVLPLLNMLGIDRPDVYKTVLGSLTAHLLVTIPSLSEDKKLQLLKNFFPYIDVKDLQDIPVLLLKSIGTLPEEFLIKIIQNEELYENMTPGVKKQCWFVSDEIFEKELSPLFDAYMDDYDDLASSWNFHVDHTKNSFWPQTRRGRCRSLQPILDIIDKSMDLYTIATAYIKKRFASTGDLRYCSLRADVLMMLHDREVKEITEQDPIHQLAWCIDACIKGGELDQNYVNEMQRQFNGFKPGSPIIGDATMILGTPASLTMMFRSLFGFLKELVDDEELPREDDLTVYVATLIHAGLLSRDLVSSKEYKIMEVDKATITKFLPAIMSLLVDDLTAEQKSKLTRLQSTLPGKEKSDVVSKKRQPVPSGVGSLCPNSDFAILTLFQYLHTAVSGGDEVRVMEVSKEIMDMNPSEDLLCYGAMSLAHMLQSLSGKVKETAREAALHHYLLPMAIKSWRAHVAFIRYMQSHVVRENIDEVKEVLQQTVESGHLDNRGAVVREYQAFYDAVSGANAQPSSKISRTALTASASGMTGIPGAAFAFTFVKNFVENPPIVD